MGTRTGGAGRVFRMVPLGHGFNMGVSIFQVMDPETGAEWEHVGVQPDLPVPPERALDEAHAAALKKLIAAPSDPGHSSALKRTLETVEARLQPKRVDPKRLARFVGRYQAGIVSSTNGKLFLKRNEGAFGEELTPLGGDRFALGLNRFLFSEKAEKVTLTLERADGMQMSFPREDAKTQARR